MSDTDKAFLHKFWDTIFSSIEEWRLMDIKKLTKSSFKEDYVLSLSIVINAMGRLGHYFYIKKLELKVLNGLNDIDWSRNNSEWMGRIYNEQGKIAGKEDSVIKICNLIKLKLGLNLNKDEMVKENELK